MPGRGAEHTKDPYDRLGGGTSRQRRGRGPVRPARRPARARGCRVVPRARLPARGDPHAGDVRVGRAARARRQGEGAAGDRQDDRGEDRPDRRDRRHRGAREAPRARAARRRRVHAPSRARPEDGGADLARARHHDARGAEGGGGGRAAPRAHRARREERGEDPEGARVPGREPRRGTAAARRRAPRGAGRRRRAPRASRRRRGVRGRLGASPQGDVPRPRHHRDAPPILPSSRRTSRSSTGSWRSSRAATRRRPSSRARGSASICASCRRSRSATCCSTSPARRSTTSRCARTPCGAGSRSRSTGSRTSRRATSSRREDEDALYEYLGYQPIPPELRENAGELEAARRGELPALVELGQTPRRPAHAHDWSADGKNTLEEMVAAALARGYEYYAITDHSHYLRDGRLAAQLEEIERMRERFPKIRILAGVEANIRSNGEVDVRGRRARAARLGRRLRAPGAGHATDGARARGDGQSVRRLHRSSHRATHR